MTKHKERLQRNQEQHKAKNILSKDDDSIILEVMEEIIKHLDQRFDLHNLGYKIEYTKSIKL